LPPTLGEHPCRTIRETLNKLLEKGSQKSTYTTVEEELERVKRELAQVKQERDILRKL
jgi:transposase-like protein